MSTNDIDMFMVAFIVLLFSVLQIEKTLVHSEWIFSKTKRWRQVLAVKAEFDLYS